VTRIYLISNANHETLYAKLPYVIAWSSFITCFLLLQLYLSHYFCKAVNAKELFNISKYESDKEEPILKSEIEENSENVDTDNDIPKMSNGPKNASGNSNKAI